MLVGGIILDIAGVALGEAPRLSFTPRTFASLAYLAIFGSVIAFTVPVDETTADAVSSLFVEVIVGPSFSDEAVEILGRKKNLRVLEGRATWPSSSLDYKRVRGGVLVQERPQTVIDDAGWKVVTTREPKENPASEYGSSG